MKKEKSSDVKNVGSLEYTSASDLVINRTSASQSNAAQVYIGSYDRYADEFKDDGILIPQKQLPRLIAILQKAHSDISSEEARLNMQVSH